LADLRTLEGEDDVVGAEQHLVSSELERCGIEGRSLGEQSAYPSLRVWSERHDQVELVGDRDRFGGEGGEEVGDFVEENAPERCDEHGSLVAAHQDHGCVTVQALVRATADPHLAQLRGRQVELNQLSATAACEENTTVNDLEPARHGCLVGVLEDNRVTDDRRTGWFCHPHSFGRRRSVVLGENPPATFGQLRT
jgi:hypothetical protein